MDAIERLRTLFERFPGIGPRQAERFVQYILRSSPSLRRELTAAIENLGTSAHQCAECMRYFSGREKICSICSNKGRDTQTLVIVASDADFAALEGSGVYRGRYFVLGGTISLARDMTKGLRIKQLLASMPSRVKNGLKEVILAFPANPEGDATAVRIQEELVALPTASSLTITSLGRGLSTGSELEYADANTLKSALENRR